MNWDKLREDYKSERYNILLSVVSVITIGLLLYGEVNNEAFIIHTFSTCASSGSGLLACSSMVVGASAIFSYILVNAFKKTFRPILYIIGIISGTLVATYPLSLVLQFL